MRGRLGARIGEALNQIQPAIICVNGWNDPSAVLAFRWTLVTGRRVIVMCDSTAEDTRRRWWREAVKRRVVRLGSAALVAGTPQQQYMRSLGMTRERIFSGYDVVDNAHFIRGAIAARHGAVRLRSRLGLPDHFFLVCGRFIGTGVDAGVKNHLRLLDAYLRYKERAGLTAWKLVLVGDGEQRAQIERHRSALGLQADVAILGFKRYNDLPMYYGLASAFVLPSLKETWGLVVNEAMAAGLPVLVSRRCGCARDLVREGLNGFTFDPYDVDELATLMHKIAHGGVDRERMGRASQKIIRRWGLERFADALMKAVEAALASPVPKATWFDTALLWVLAHR